MTAQTYLEQIGRLDDQIKRLEAEIYRNRAMLLPGAVRYDTDRVQVSPRDRMAEIMAKVGDLIEEQTRKRVALAEKRDRIIEEIHEIKGAKGACASVLYYRYVMRLRYESVADAVGYSVAHVKKLHRWGLDEFERKIVKRQ